MNTESYNLKSSSPVYIKSDHQARALALQQLKPPDQDKYSGSKFALPQDRHHSAHDQSSMDQLNWSLKPESQLTAFFPPLLPTLTKILMNQNTASMIGHQNQ